MFEYKYFDAHTHSSKTILDQVYENLCHPCISESICFGIHPYALENMSSIDIEAALKDLESYLIIGECGLDRSITCDFSLQIEVFVKHLDHANLFGKLVIIHSVKANSDLLKLRKSYNNPWFIHGFLGHINSIKQFLCLNQDIWFGFGSMLFSSNKLCDTLIECPLEHILLETDDQNEYKIEDIYSKVCQLKQISLTDLQIIIKENFFRCFHNLGN
ncbi:TatD family hydrolase [bacterium]|nr:TatD family hydrolase [bacterium]